MQRARLLAQGEGAGEAPVGPAAGVQSDNVRVTRVATPRGPPYVTRTINIHMATLDDVKSSEFIKIIAILMYVA